MQEILQNQIEFTLFLFNLTSIDPFRGVAASVVHKTLFKWGSENTPAIAVYFCRGEGL